MHTALFQLWREGFLKHAPLSARPRFAVVPRHELAHLIDELVASGYVARSDRATGRFVFVRSFEDEAQGLAAVAEVVRNWFNLRRARRELKAGDQIVVRDLAQELGVYPPAVRAACRDLHAQGVLDPLGAETAPSRWVVR